MRTSAGCISQPSTMSEPPAATLSPGVSPCDIRRGRLVIQGLPRRRAGGGMRFPPALQRRRRRSFPRTTATFSLTKTPRISLRWSAQSTFSAPNDDGHYCGLLIQRDNGGNGGRQPVCRSAEWFETVCCRRWASRVPESFFQRLNLSLRRLCARLGCQCWLCPRVDGPLL